MAGGPERRRAGRLRRVGPLVVVGADERVDVDEVGRVRQLPGVLADAHARFTYPVDAVATLRGANARRTRPVATAELVASEDVILVGGEALYDLVVDGDDDLRGHPGGAAFTTARTIGRLGQPVAYLGRLSTDRFGTTLERMLAADGVRLDAVVRTDEPTTLALAEIDETGSARYRFYERATSAPGLTPEAALAALPPAVGILHVGTLGLTLEPMATALEAVVEELSGQALVMVDPNVPPVDHRRRRQPTAAACAACSAAATWSRSPRRTSPGSSRIAARLTPRGCCSRPARASCCSRAAPTGRWS